MFLSGEKIGEQMSNLIHKETQINDDRVHLTAKTLFSLENSGQLDFGGSEYKKPKPIKLAPKKQSPQDKYGWWHLEQGVYLVIFNEKVNLSDKQMGLIQPLPRLTINRATHNPKIISTSLDEPIVLVVYGKTISIKENARLSELLVWC